MKTIATFFVAAFALLSITSFSQEQKSVFENANLARSGDGLPCVQLNWKKGTENTNFYLVERSTDGKEFKQIAVVFTSEDPGFTDFQYRDKGYTASGNTVYYRIAIVNDQKEISYLPMKMVMLSNNGNTAVEVDATNTEK
jgi:hypothetical protein